MFVLVRTASVSRFYYALIIHDIHKNNKDIKIIVLKFLSILQLLISLYMYCKSMFLLCFYFLQEVDRENEEGMNTDLMVDVDEDLQNELCKLWDMSMNAVCCIYHISLKFS